MERHERAAPLCARARPAARSWSTVVAAGMQWISRWQSATPPSASLRPPPRHGGWVPVHLRIRRSAPGTRLGLTWDRAKRSPLRPRRQHHCAARRRRGRAHPKQRRESGHRSPWPAPDALPARPARELLDTLRAIRQRFASLDLILVEYPEGPISTALGDPEHPLYLAGDQRVIRRATPARFYRDFAITRDWTDVSLELVGASAELAAGVPALVWTVIKLAPAKPSSPATRGSEGWQELRRLTATTTAHQWELLRRVHPLAQPIITAMSVGLRPHSIDANSKSVNEGLTDSVRLVSRGERSSDRGCSPTLSSPRGPATMQLPGHSERASSHRLRAPSGARGRRGRTSGAPTLRSARGGIAYSSACFRACRTSSSYSSSGRTAIMNRSASESRAYANSQPRVP